MHNNVPSACNCLSSTHSFSLSLKTIQWCWYILPFFLFLIFKFMWSKKFFSWATILAHSSRQSNERSLVIGRNSEPSTHRQLNINKSSVNTVTRKIDNKIAENSNWNRIQIWLYVSFPVASLPLFINICNRNGDGLIWPNADGPLDAGHSITAHSFLWPWRNEKKLSWTWSDPKQKQQKCTLDRRKYKYKFDRWSTNNGTFLLIDFMCYCFRRFAERFTAWD